MRPIYDATGVFISLATKGGTDKNEVSAGRPLTSIVGCSTSADKSVRAGAELLERLDTFVSFLNLPFSS